MKSPNKKLGDMSAGVLATGLGVGLFIAITILAHAQTNSTNTQSGDAVLQSSTVSVSSPKSTTTLAIVVSTSSAPVGSSVHARAVLGGMTATASGTVAYTIYTDKSCAKSIQDAGVKNVTDGYVPASNAFFFHVASTYYWQAVYSGDAHNASAVSLCQSGILTLYGSSASVTQVSSPAPSPVPPAVSTTTLLHSVLTTILPPVANIPQKIKVSPLLLGLHLGQINRMLQQEITKDKVQDSDNDAQDTTAIKNKVKAAHSKVKQPLHIEARKQQTQKEKLEVPQEQNQESNQDD